ncbi:dynein light chain roadblock-type 2 [Batrachochytrium dendrobatidis JEL423]|uniref:Dynein light chain roadblock-type 2 n=1 Tax=Batrachochytrium dendrobatidis (strain JEL423) TaxID=403673 RepID=A0A177WZK3_BATDL|nr:dynein light chain roadblock-type 2 [Batrachochytrium dendrobatidis JEL423]
MLQCSTGVYITLLATFSKPTLFTFNPGIVIATHEGSVIRSTLDNIQTPQISTLVVQLAARGKSVVRDLDPEDELTFLRIRSKKHEIMVAEISADRHPKPT